MFRQQTLKEMSSYYVLLTIGTTSYIVLRNKYINKQQLLYKNNNYNNTNNNNDNVNKVSSKPILTGRTNNKTINEATFTRGDTTTSQQSALPQLIGQTPLIELKSLSKLTSNRIYAKCEFLNPGGSSKDRIAKQMVLEAEKSGHLKKGGTIVEGTAGSTGISLSLMAASRGYKCHIVMPNDAAKEKTDLLKKFGAIVSILIIIYIYSNRCRFNM